MNNINFAFFLTLLAGLSTMIGYIVIFIKKKNHQKIIVSSLSFAAGVMISTSIIDLIPESLLLLTKNISSFNSLALCFLGLLLGIITSMIIDYYLPDVTDIKKDNSLFRIGLISMIAIILHNIPEDCIKYVSQEI